MNQDNNPTGKPPDETKAAQDRHVLDELERRLQMMRPVAPVVDLAAVERRALKPGVLTASHSSARAAAIVHSKSTGQLVRARSVRQVATVAVAWLCGLAMGMAAMIIYQAGGATGADTHAIKTLRNETQRDAEQLPPTQDDVVPKAADRPGAKQVDPNHGRRLAASPLSHGQLAALIDRPQPEIDGAGEIWRIGMSLRTDVESRWPALRDEPRTVIVAATGPPAAGAAEATHSNVEIPQPPAPTRDNLLREMENWRKSRAF
jgi:hypothetical protein